MSLNHDCGCGGPIGPMGLGGPQGPQGVDGLQGVPGQTGAQGPVGAVGPMGLQGLQGPKGDCVECNNGPVKAANEYAQVYSSNAQTLAASTGTNLPGQAVLLEKTIVSTPNIDVSAAGTTGAITVNLAGWYDVASGMSGSLNPIPSPLPVWTLSLFVNGVYVPGSTFANTPISPEQQSNEIVADVFMHLNVGDKLTLASTSTAPIQLTAPTLGTNAATNSAYLKIQLLSAD